MSRLLILFTFLYHTLQAGEGSYPFFGITGSLHTIELQPTVTEAPNRLNNPESEDVTTFGLQYGMQTKDYRTTFSYETSSDFQTFDLSVDYIIMDDMFGTAKIRPYVGVTLGYILYDESLIVAYNENAISLNEANSEDSVISTSDGYYGFDVGMLFYITDNLDLDIGYHYYLMDRLEPLDTMNGITFSLHYFY
ncbi:MAG: opacity family porin [Sulfurovum sp.]|nr:opacity family porin [Sulfurovum sp.]